MARTRTTAAEMAARRAAATIGAKWVHLYPATGRPVSTVTITALKDGPRGIYARTKSRTGERWTQLETLIHHYRPAGSEGSGGLKPAAEQANGAGDYLRKIVREELAAFAATVSLGREQALRAIREECLAAIREAFGETRAS